MEPPPNQRTIRAPGTIIKTGKPNPYSGYLIAQQRQFRIINPAGSRTISRQSHNQQLTQNDVNDQVVSPPPPPPPQTYGTVAIEPKLASSSTKSGLPSASSTSRLSTLKTSGLARPMPVREIISAIPATTSSIKQPQSRLPSALSNSNTKLATLRPPTAPSMTSAASTATARLQANHIEKPRALTRTKLSPSPSQRLTTAATGTVTRPGHQEQQPVISSTTPAQQHHRQLELHNALDLPSIAGDVGHIRRVLEDLYRMLQVNAKQDESLVQENERLRCEVAELKSQLRAVKSVISVNRVPANRSEVQLSSDDGQSDTTAITIGDDVVGSSNNLNRPRSSLYFTPMNN